MSKMERVVDTCDALSPLRITRSKARKTYQPRIRVKCGCCDEAVEIYHEAEPTGDEHQDCLEINGVSGTVNQWRQVLLPLLEKK